MDKANENYVLLCQQAHYSSHNGVNPLVIVKLEETSKTAMDKYFVYGPYQDEGAKATEKLTLYFVTKIPRYRITEIGQNVLSNSSTLMTTKSPTDSLSSKPSSC